MRLSIDVNGTSYPVSVRVEPRRTARASIGARGVSIRLPQGLSRERREGELERLLGWASRRLERIPVQRYASGQELLAGGRRYVLEIHVRRRKTSTAHIQGRRIHIVLSSRLPAREHAPVVGTLLSRSLAREHLPGIRRRVEELALAHFQVEVGRVSLRNNRCTWGSCSQKGNLSFSTRLLLAPPDVIDYVLVHELAHFCVRNHSAAFWSLVRRVMPDYEESKRWLRVHGCELVW